jgi:cobalamin biosynthetic protein CobC
MAHGGRLNQARRDFPAAPAPFIDLSTGINPRPYPVPELPAASWQRLPEPEDEAALLAAVAARYGVDPSCIVAAPGTQLLIGLLPRLFPAAAVCVPGLTYGEHAAAWMAAGAVLRPDAPTMVLCQPNNPDGARRPRAELLALADDCAARGGLLVVDEAFIDVHPPSLADALPHPGLVVLRSFGKTYGLAGLRLGFALGSPERVAVIRDVLGPWAVSGPALAIGRAALADGAWLADTAAWLAAAAARLDGMLERAGAQVVGGTSLFRLVAHPDAAGWYRRLGEAGILVRRFAEQPEWLRFGMPADEAAWRRLAAALG